MFRYGSPVEIILGLEWAPRLQGGNGNPPSCLAWTSTVDRGAQ